MRWKARRLAAFLVLKKGFVSFVGFVLKRNVIYDILCSIILFKNVKYSLQNSVFV